MALWHDIAARALQIGGSGAPRPDAARALSGADLPEAEVIRADTEAGELPVRLYRRPQVGDDAPVYIHFHAGGFLRRQPERDDHICRHIAAELGCVVLNPDYDVAPQARFPVAPTQALALCWWASFAGRKQGWNGKRVAVGGQGAGANLAIGTSLDLPARMGFKPRALVAVSPLLDFGRPAESWRARVATAAYLPDRVSRSAPLASPLRADKLDGLAPTLLVCGDGDSRRTDAEDFYTRLEAAGVPAGLEIIGGAGRDLFHAAPPDVVQKAAAALVAFLEPHLADGHPRS